MGKPSPGIELAVLNAEGETVLDEEGEIAVLITPLSKNLIFSGYRRVAGRDFVVARPERTDKRGRQWYLTGDRAYVDKDGYFWFVGRDDDVPPRQRIYHLVFFFFLGFGFG
jgi:medium-chain acyl-CoA synthetase